MRVNDLRHRPPQSRHRLDRLRDRLRRAQGPAGPETTSTSPCGSATATRRRAGCWSAAAPPSRDFLAARDAARPRRDADELPGHRRGRADPRGRARDGAGPTSSWSPIVDDDGALTGVVTERALARRYIRESRHTSTLEEAPDVRERDRRRCSRASCCAGEDRQLSGRVWVHAMDVDTAERDLRRRRRRGRQPTRGAAAGDRARRRAGGPLQLRPPRATRCSSAPASEAPRSSSRRWTATSPAG